MKNSLPRPLAILGLSLLLAVPAPAATKTWDSGGGNTNWSDANNWNPTGVPTSSDAVLLDNSAVNPVPSINPQANSNCATLTIDGTISGNFLSSGNSTPVVLILNGATANSANTGPLINVTSNASVSAAANKVNFRLNTSGELYVEAGKTFQLTNSNISEVSGTPRTLTKTGDGSLTFGGSGPKMTFTGGFNIASGTVIANANTLCLPASGTINFTNPLGTTAAIQSGQSHTIAALSGGNDDSSIYVTGTNGLTVNGSASTTFGGSIQDNGTNLTKLTYSGSGSLTLTGDNTYTGPTTITSGKLALGPGGALASPSLAISAGATFDVSTLPGGYTLPGGNTLSGGSGATAGIILGPFTADTDSIVSPGGGGAGTLSFSNGFTLASGAHLLLHINSPTPGAGYDQIVVTGGNVLLSGDLSGSALGYTPATGDTFYLLRNTGPGATSGTLNGVPDGGKLDFGGKWFRVSLTSAQTGAGFQIGGSGKDVALQRINDPTPSAFAATIIGPTDQTVVQLQLSWTDNATTETGFRLYRVLADNSLQLVATLAPNATTYSEVISSSAVNTYAIQAFNASGLVGDLNYVTSPNLGNTLADRQKLVLDYLQANTPNLGQKGDGPHRIGRTGFWFGEGRLQRGDTTNGLNFITTAIEDANAESSNAGFSLWPGMDAYYRWGQLFPPALKSRYQTIYTTATLYGGSSTPNQRFMTCTGSYLANNVWGSAVNSVSSAGYQTLNLFGQTDNTSKTDVTGKTYLQNEIERIPRRGFQEDDSNHYLHFTIAPIRTLAEFAPDASLKNKAQMVFDYGMAIAASGWLNGRNCITSSRGGISAQQNSYDNLPRTCWLPFGGVTPNTFSDAENQTIFAQPSFTGVAPEIAAAATDRTQSYTRRSTAERQIGPEVVYFKQSWMTPHYSLWSQAEGEVAFNSDASFILKNMDVQAIHDGWQASRWALAWDDPTGTDSTLRITAPTNYKTATNAGMSIYEDTLQKEDTMIAVYNIPTTDFTSGNNGVSPCHLLSGHISTQYLAITDESATTGRLFLHYNNVLVALYLSAPFTWSNNFQITPWSKGSLAVETAPVADYPQATPAARLAAFRSDVLANGSVNITSINATAPRFIYKNRKGRTFDLTYGQPGIINGDPVDYLQWPMLESPAMYQPQMGNLFVFGTDRTLLYNFNDWTTLINNRPAVATTAPAIAVTNTPLDIDLATRVTDTETPSANLAFTLGAPTSGALQLLPDGHTARFTSAANSTAPVTFPFTATDRGIHPRLVFHYDFEPPATLAANTIADASLNARPATLLKIGSGGALLDTTASPTPLGPNSAQSLRLTETGATGNAARLSRLVTPSNLSMSNGDWTFSTWFKRATRATDDFILYLGNGDGLGGSGDELQLYLPANSDALTLTHYNAANAADINLTAPNALANVWHHAAVTFTRTAANTGVVRLYLDGALAATSPSVTWSLHQDTPVILGGHATTTGATLARYLDGWLDDTALLSAALPPAEIASLATQSVATYGGLRVSGAVSLTVLTPLENWRNTNWQTTANTGVSANLADPDADGLPNLIEYALGDDPKSAASAAQPTISIPSGFLKLTFLRLRPDLTYTIQGSDDLAAWTDLATNPGTLGAPYTYTDTSANPRRFLRLKVTSP